MMLCAHKSAPLTGHVSVPGDKSLSHRALMLGALATGQTTIAGLLEGEDVLATAAAMQALGALVERDAAGNYVVQGCGSGGLREPVSVLDMGNSGTAARLLSGVLATHPFTSFMTGDVSLCSRPMGRVVNPLALAGASFVTRSENRLPMAIRGAPMPLPIDYVSPVASAQIKSALLLAGLNAPGWTSVVEPRQSRDHSERMLTAFGAEVDVEECGKGIRVRIRGEAELKGQTLRVAGDPSSAAFLAVAASVIEGSDIEISSVGTNPTRTGLFTTLREMGADLEFHNERIEGGEPVADLLVRSSKLRGVEVPETRVPSMVDEFPILSVAAASANGKTVMRGLSELRVKESDRIAVMAEGLQASGIAVEVEGDDMTVTGAGSIEGGVCVEAHHDHRIAMSFLILGGLSEKPITVSGAETINTSFPGFVDLLNSIGGKIGKVDHELA